MKGLYEFNNRGASEPGRAVHFLFEVNGVTYLYAYIRKNGCSAFKAMLYGESEGLAQKTDCGTLNIDNIIAQNGVREFDEVPSGVKPIFVFRDPVKRVCSIFKNKFIALKEEEDIVKSVAKLLERNVGDVTFRDFVEGYLRNPPAIIDPHCWTQKSHLFPITYSYAIDIEFLFSVIRLLMGQAVAESYFSKKVNSSSCGESKCKLGYSVADTPLDLLIKNYRRDNVMPTDDLLLTDDLRECIVGLYEEDYKMISSLSEVSDKDLFDVDR